MGKVCMECLEEYKNDDLMSVLKQSEVGLYQECPKRMCDGKVYNIDDGIIPTIILLNSKGYNTYSSCSGHQLEKRTECYIEFDENIKELDFLPQNFKLRAKTVNGVRRLCIYFVPDSSDSITQLDDLFFSWERLYEWAMILELGLDGFDVVMIDMDLGDMSPYGFLDFFGIQGTSQDKPKKTEKPGLDIEKLKRSAVTSIKLNQNVTEEKTEKRKSGRPKKKKD